MGKLAITGGKPTRKKPFTAWPAYTREEARGLQKVLASRNWGGYPFPNKVADAFAQKFARYHGAKYGLAVANGTIAIEVALKAAGIRGIHRSQAGPRLQRRRGDRGGQEGARGDQEGVVPSRDGLRIRLRRLQVPGRLDRKGAAHPARGVHSGVAGGLHVPRGFAVHADPDPGGSGVADRDLLCPAVAGAVDQPDHAVRDWCWRSASWWTTRSWWSKRCTPRWPEKHLSPYRATKEVMHEISGAIIAITLVMTSVFVPVTFIPGPVGTFYRQFGITMATSIILSGRGGPDADAGALCDDSQAPRPRRHGLARALTRRNAARTSGQSAVCSWEGCWSWAESPIGV